MNNMSTSECSSGRESGWTMYLDQSGDEERHHKGGGRGGKRPNVSVLQEQGEDHDEDEDEDEDDNDEDLSMVSDASSGPGPGQQQVHVHDDEEDNSSQQRMRIRIKPTKQTTKTRLNPHKTSYLDDTASSPGFTLSKSKKDEASMEHDTGLSKESKGKSRYQKHFGFLKKSSPAPEKAATDKSCGLQGRRWQ